MRSWSSNQKSKSQHVSMADDKEKLELVSLIVSLTCDARYFTVYSTIVCYTKVKTNKETNKNFLKIAAVGFSVICSWKKSILTSYLKKKKKKIYLPHALPWEVTRKHAPQKQEKLWRSENRWSHTGRLPRGISSILVLRTALRQQPHCAPEEGSVYVGNALSADAGEDAGKEGMEVPETPGKAGLYCRSWVVSKIRLWSWLHPWERRRRPLKVSATSRLAAGLWGSWKGTGKSWQWGFYRA